ncbi:hypothetical protein BA904_27505 [Klebsiella pneumoniae]|nr:hypothetical protein BA904_27505 [Klebsiella pneumoniae]
MGMMMEKRLPGLDLDALRSFVTGMECGSFAQAALRLSRSTSAVSAHTVTPSLRARVGRASAAPPGNRHKR